MSSIRRRGRADCPREQCGVVAVYSPGEQASRLAYFGLFALQHRGQESAGIASSNGERLFLHTQMGLVAQAFREEDLERLPGALAIGHTRYSTTGSSRIQNAQPFLVRGPYGPLALAHNGNVVNALELRRELEEWGCTFTSSADSEVIAHLLANAPGRDWGERVAYMMRRVRGAYSLTVLLPEGVMAIRDPLGVRPLALGVLNGGKGWVVASESCALDHLGARFLREVRPGEALLINGDGVRTLHRAEEGRHALCIFEFIYFARPDSVLNDRRVYEARVEMGRQLAREHPVEADVVIGVPDSSIPAAIGYSEESGIPYRDGLVKNRYVGRTFIQPDQRLREVGVRLKFNPLPEVLAGKRVVVVDDSIVRGTTTPRVVRLLRQAGAREVHLRICAPPIRWPCHFGIDMATRRELIAATRSVEGIRQAVGADSLGYLSIEGLYRAVGLEPTRFCTACFTGDYPIPVQLEMDKLVLEML